MNLQLLLSSFLLLVVDYISDDATAQSTLEILELVRQKVRFLETTGQIKRDYQPYFQRDLKDGETYDFIIVGAGSSGSVLANRLSEIHKWKILLLEAGGEPDMLSEIPFWSVLTHATDLNWNFMPEKEENFGLAFQDQRMRWPRGKGLGGSSLLNQMIVARGVREDYDKWGENGNPGWTYDRILPYLKKLENVHIPNNDVDYRGDSGPISVEYPYVTESGRAFIEAASNKGYPYLDYNGRTNRGVSSIQANMKRGLRCSGERCYIKPIKNRRNLTICLSAHVTKVLIKHRAAYGVEYYKDGRSFKAYAKKEVILSSGAIGSPHILLLSGIGPKKQLLNFGIQPIADLPVGQKILDHQAYYGLGFLFNQSIVFDAPVAFADKSFKELYNDAEGSLRSIGTAEGILFTTTTVSSSNRTDIELIFGSSFLNSPPNASIGGLIGLDEGFYTKMFQSYVNTPAGLCVPVLLHPKSFGRLELQSADPFVHPKLHAGYFTDPDGIDMKTMIAGIRECIRIVLSSPFDKYGVRMIDKPILGCEAHNFGSDGYWECAIRHLTTTLFHQTTGCKMGPVHDPEAVVDHNLKVYGIRKLRVMDSSVIPVSITGHLNIPSYLVGEVGSDIIKEKYLGCFK